MRFLLICAASGLLAVGCGQKGPLFLRDNPPPGYKPLKPPAPKPVPYPDQGADQGAHHGGERDAK